MSINGRDVTMELDTGAAVSLVSEMMFQSLWPDVSLQQASVRLQTYSGDPLPVLGQVEVEVKYGKQQASLPLTVVKNGGPSLFGRDWLTRFQLDWREIHRVENTTLEGVLDRHSCQVPWSRPCH